jgi:hypothetical protein
MDRKLLTDIEMQRFINDGFLMLRPGLPPEFHQQVFAEIDSVYENEGNPGNNLLPRVPLLQQVFDDPPICGALESILGADYFLYPHRHCHFRIPGFVPRGGINQDPVKGRFGGKLHKDDMSHRRRHRTRWAMCLYYPQHTTADMGATTILPGSQYYTSLAGVDLRREFPICVDAGTIVLTNYDMWHAATLNTSSRKRAMVAFLFARMSEPQDPSWDCENQDWNPGPGVAHPELKKHLWDWHCGRSAGGFAGGEDLPNGSISELVGSAAANSALGETNRAMWTPVDETQQEGASEPLWLDTIYALAAVGEAAVPALIDALANPSEGIRRGFTYALSAIGEAAVPALTKALEHADPGIRAGAAEALADMGKDAGDALPQLISCLQDPADEVAGCAAEALGLIASAPGGVPRALARTLGHSAERVRMRAAMALARLGPEAEDATPELATALDDDNRYVRGKAVHALFSIGSEKAREALFRHLFTHRWDNLTYGLKTH